MDEDSKCAIDGYVEGGYVPDGRDSSGERGELAVDDCCEEAILMMVMNLLMTNYQMRRCVRLLLLDT